MAKPSSSSNNSSSTNKKKKSKARPNLISMKHKADKPSQTKNNPFETIWSRRKFDVVGKKRKGEERRLGLARKLAIDKRKKTLLKEYKQSGKASVFVDKRIGEQDDTLPEFDKAILRSQRERQKKVKKTSKYNLSDGEEEELEIHGGQWDDFDEELEQGSDDEYVEQDVDGSGRLRRIRKLNVWNSAGDDSANGAEDRQKSKKEVMEEVIRKSKFFKAQKAMEKEENEQLVDQLDKDFESLVKSQAFSSLTQPDKINALKALVNPNYSKELKQQNVTSAAKISKQNEPDSYDKLVNEMMMEIRARPSDRTKTPEEIAEEEKERLEHMEQERQNRMLATDDATDDEPDDSEGLGRPSAKLSSHISGDDLGDSFTVDEKPQHKKGWVDEIFDREEVENNVDEDSECSDDSKGSEDSGEDADSDKEVETLKDWEQSDDDVDFDSEGEEVESDEEAEAEGEDGEEIVGSERTGEKIGLSSNKGKEVVKNSAMLKQELPFKIDAPEKKEELYKLFEGRSNEEVIEAIRRIRVCNAIALGPEYRKKIQVFYGLLLQHFATLANQKPLNFQLLNLLVKPLMEMSTEIPYFSAICARERMFRIRKKLCEDIKNPDKSCWPSLKSLLLLRLWSMIFPCSDFRHAVMTPAMLLMCEYLMCCPVLSVRDAAIGSFLCSMVLVVVKQSQKFCPEAVIFLKTILLTAVDRDSQEDSKGYRHLLELKAPMPLLRVQERVEEIKPLDLIKLMNLPEDSSFFNSDGFRASVLVSVVETLRGFANVYGNFKAYPEIFLPISNLLSEVADQQNISDSVQEKLRNVAEIINEKVEEHHQLRRPLQIRKQKPVPIKLLNPKFEENFVKGRDYDPDRERAESKKIRKLVRKEERGAVRELRKDNYFLLTVKEKEKRRAEQERAEKYGKAKAFLQEQEHAFKSGQLGKSNKRKR